MITKLAAITVLPMLLVGGVVANSSVLLVDVDEGETGTRIMIPVPLAVAQVALAFAPDHIKRLEVPEEASRYLPYLDRIVGELERIPDALLVDVEDGTDHVQLYKEGDTIRVRVRERSDTRVDVNVPLAMVRAVVDAYDAEGGYFRASRLVGALRAAPSGDLVHVLDGQEEVRIRMW